MTRKQRDGKWSARRERDIPKAGSNKTRPAGGQRRGGDVQKGAWAGDAGAGAEGEGTTSNRGPWRLRAMGVN